VLHPYAKDPLFCPARSALICREFYF